MILRRKYSPFATSDLSSLATPPDQPLRWFEDFCRTHKRTAAMGMPIVRLLRGDSHESGGTIRLHGLVRLSKGRLCRIRVKPTVPIKLRLAHYGFSFTAGVVPKLEDQHGQIYRLHPGKNYVGLDSGDIRIDARFDQISPMHVIIETDPCGDLLFTDLSDRGTYLPPQCVL